MPSAALHTLGCKVNQYETQRIADGLTARGFDLRPFSDIVDVYIINTCTVTHIADSKSRQAIHSAIRRNPSAYVIVTGCYAETSEAELSAIRGVTMVIGNKDKSQIADRIASLFVDECKSFDANATFHAHVRTRALLKIQDGCNQFCSYCAIPFVRPKMWSKPFQEAIDEVKVMAEKGYKEVVLTGIRTGLYNDDGDLVDLIENISEIDGIERLRISSIEITDVPQRLLQLMATNEKVCPHLHLPLQSGDNKVLKSMNRPYTAEQFLDFVHMARSIVPRIGITTDIIVGFPGEGGEEFENTCRVVKQAQFAKAHIFRFSPRKGTAASLLADDVPPSEKEARSKILMGITKKSADEFAHNLIGEDVSVLVEGKEHKDGIYSGLTDNYARIFMRCDKYKKGNIVKVHVNDINDGKLFGVIRS